MSSMSGRKGMLLLLHAPAALTTNFLSLSSPKWAGRPAFCCYLGRKGMESSPSCSRCFCSPSSLPGAAEDGGAPTTASKPSAISHRWTLRDSTKSPPVPVSLEEYVALGPGYRPRRHHRQQELSPALQREPTAASRPISNLPGVAGGNGTASKAHHHRRQQQHQRRAGEAWEGAEEWLSASIDLAASLGIDPSTSNEAQHRRVFHLYLPVYFWLKRLLLRSRDGRSSSIPASSPARLDAAEKPLVVGMNAPQGCGKTTLVSEMQRMLGKDGYHCVVVSIDDFYLTGEEQDALAARYPTNPLLQVRGNAGTHDLALALRTIRALAGRKSGSAAEGSGDPRAPAPTAQSAAATFDESGERGGGVGIGVPRYDKSARAGKGDRAPEGDWSVVAARPDIVLFEGWMLGFEALPDDSPLLLSAAGVKDGEDNGLAVVNTFLKDYQELHDEVDAWLVIKTAEPEMVFEWRAEAERRMREAGRPGMSEEQVRDFCSRFMPAYRAYLPGLYEACRDKTAGVDGGGRERRPGEGGDGDDRASKEMRRGSSGESFGDGEEERTLVIEVGKDRNPVL